MKEKLLSLKNKPVVLLAMAALLLLVSTVGVTQAAITYYSDDYETHVEVKNIAVSLKENDAVISNSAEVVEGKLFANLLATGEKFVVGKEYNEDLSVVNNGTMDAYVRVIITKSWTDEKNAPYRQLSPDYIELEILKSDDWKVDKNASTAERTVIYYTKKLAVGAETVDFADSIRLDNAFETTLDQRVESVTDGQIITYTHPFDGYTFNVEVEVDAVQTNNAVEAIKSAWGVDVTVSETDGSLTF